MRHLKKDVLAVLADGAPYSAASIAMGAGFSLDSIYPYLKYRLERQRLVERDRVGRRLAWRITEKGRARLKWFRKHPGYFAWRMRRRKGLRLWV